MSSKKGKEKLSGTLCVGCLFALSSLGNYIVAPCCKRELCVSCLDTLPNCPVCRIPIARNLIGVIPQTNPPPYFSLAPKKNPAAPLNLMDDDIPPLEPEWGGFQSANDEETPSYDHGLNCENSFSNIAELQTTPDGICVIHYISSHDTLVGISLKYNIPVAEIRRVNQLFSSNIHEKEKLLIPKVDRLPNNMSDPTDEMKQERERIRRTKRFQIATKCLDNSEISYYLEAANYDVDQAVAKYEEDLKWEAHNAPSGRALRAHSLGSAAAAAQGKQKGKRERERIFCFI